MKPFCVGQVARSLIVGSAALALLSALPADAANKKFAGKWEKNIEATEADNEIWPETMVVTLDGETVSVDRTVVNPESGDMNVKFAYKESPEPYELPALFGPPRVVTSKWSGKKLVIKFERPAPNGMVGKVVETWKMKGKQLEIKYSARLPVGTFVQKHVYDRID